MRKTPVSFIAPKIMVVWDNLEEAFYTHGKSYGSVAKFLKSSKLRKLFYRDQFARFYYEY